MTLKNNAAHWTLYIIQTLDDKLYTGITTDLNRRYQEHQQGKSGAKFFRASKPKAIVHQQTGLTHSEALKLELKIKKLTRKEKLKLIHGPKK